MPDSTTPSDSKTVLVLVSRTHVTLISVVLDSPKTLLALTVTVIMLCCSNEKSSGMKLVVQRPSLLQTLELTSAR